MPAQIVLNPTLDAMVSLANPEVNFGEQEDALVGDVDQGRLILQYAQQPGEWARAVLRFQSFQAEDDKGAAGHAMLSIVPLVGLSWPIVENAVTADTSDGSHSWPNDPVPTFEGSDPGMSDVYLPRVELPWPEGGGPGYEIDITPIISGYPEAGDHWQLLIFSSEESLSASAITTQRDVDEQGVQLILISANEPRRRVSDGRITRRRIPNRRIAMRRK